MRAPIIAPVQDETIDDTDSWISPDRKMLFAATALVVLGGDVGNDLGVSEQKEMET